MKHLFVALLIASYFATGVFGVFTVHAQEDMNMQGHATALSTCAGAPAIGADCPKEVDPIGFATFHIDAFKVFSLATFGQSLLSSLLTLVFFVIAAGLSLLLVNLALPQLALVYSRYASERFSSLPKQRLLRWLALHENSPSLF